MFLLQMKNNQFANILSLSLSLSLVFKKKKSWTKDIIHNLFM